MPTYTQAQQDAITETERPLQLIACAGSGKTQVISQRISRILKQPGVLPRNIVAFTFTEKAAAELKQRVHSIIDTEHGEMVGLAEMYIGTMHGYCLNLLQTYIPEAFKFGVLTDITQRLLIDRYSKLSGLTTCPVTAAQGHLRRYQNSRLYMQALSVLQEDEVDFELVPAGVNESLHSYLHMISTRNFFDYTTMLATAVDFLETVEEEADGPTAALINHIKSDIRFVVVDEYQDVNPLQERLVAALVRFGANLCVVGDDDQTIYQWRGSQVEHILDFAKRHDKVRTIALVDNFRSSEGIVALGRAIADRIPDDQRLVKQMEYASHQKWRRGDLLALDFKDPEAEASWIVNRIQELRGVPFQDDPDSEPRGLSWSDCAVLYRTVKDAGPLVEKLRALGIPYIIKGLARLFDAPEIVALVDIFKYMNRDIDVETLRASWDASHLMPNADRFDAMVLRLNGARDFDSGERWGLYNIQRLYLELLELLEIREDTIPGTPERRELVMYQLGKFSQVISDFEAIYFSSAPAEKYRSFVGFLTFQAPTYYEESDEEASYAVPDAVTISTVHRAKGMQWPAVFVPCLRKNRFPSSVSGGLNVFHVVPMEAVPNGARYRGGLMEETRLFYVAATRAKKFLYLSFAPGPGRNQKNPSEFFTFATTITWVSTHDEGLGVDDRVIPTPKIETPPVSISFSELKYLFDCPYQFKLRFMYGFNPPLDEAIGYGKGLHDALAEMHKRAIAGDVPTRDESVELVDRHLHTPYAYPALREQLHKAAVSSIRRYFDLHGADLTRTLHSEKEIEVVVGPGVTVDGRIDLIKKIETQEVSIVDFKSTARAQQEDVTRDQLHVYALGYEELTGTSADLIEVLNLDAEGKNTREKVNTGLLDGIRGKILAVAEDIRANHFECSHDHSKDGGFDDLAWLLEGGKARTSIGD